MKIYEDLKKQLHKKGVDIINVDYYELIDVWKSWYKGVVDDFHFYNIKIADGSEVQCEKKTRAQLGIHQLLTDRRSGFSATIRNTGR